MQQAHEESQAYNFDPNNIASPEVQKKLLDLLIMRDNIYRNILKVCSAVLPDGPL